MMITSRLFVTGLMCLFLASCRSDQASAPAQQTKPEYSAPDSSRLRNLRRDVNPGYKKPAKDKDSLLPKTVSTEFND